MLPTKGPLAHNFAVELEDAAFQQVLEQYVHLSLGGQTCSCKIEPAMTLVGRGLRITVSDQPPRDAAGRAKYGPS